MIYFIAGLLVLMLTAAALYGWLKKAEVERRLVESEAAWAEEDDRRQAEIDRLQGELARLAPIRHIPDIIERAKRSKAEADARLEDARTRAEEVVAQAVAEANQKSAALTAEAQAALKSAREAERLAKWQGEQALELTRAEVKKLISEARKDAREKTKAAELRLLLSSRYAAEIEEQARRRAEEIPKRAYEVHQAHARYGAAVEALKNRIESYKSFDLAQPAHVLDELADEYAFTDPGERLKIARQRTTMLEREGLAVSTTYPEGWKRDHALKYVLGTFNGKVDSILARIKPGTEARLRQEIRDAYAIANLDGEAYKNTHINEQYLEARLEELKWGAAVQRVREKQREEQRAIREQMREEEKAKREYERAIKQAQKEEELINRALERARKEFDQASGEDKAKYEESIAALNAKLLEAEEKGRKAISMAQQTKRGYVYVISNIGSFGENVYKVGQTRRLEPMERVRELGDASVPFPFDVHAMILSDEAPALENEIHRRLIDFQVNKINKRKEFFRIDLAAIRKIIEEMGLEAEWTLTAAATEYRESLALEQELRTNPTLRERWVEEQESELDEELGEEEPYEAALADGQED